ncbi:MAG: amidohydrolase family protein [Acidobacteriota bacterium]
MAWRLTIPSPLVIGSLLAVMLSLPTPTASSVPDLVLRGGHRFDTTRQVMVKNTGIVVIRGRFMQVGGDPTAFAGPGAKIVTLADDDYILPGLIDLHAHYNMTLNKIRREETRSMPIIYLANGVTLTFPAGELDPEAMLAARRRIEAGEQVGPRLLSSGPYFGPARPGWNPDATSEEIRREIDFWASRGVAGIKVKRISARHLAAVIEAAHAHGLTVTGHLDSGFHDTVNSRDAIRMGIDRIEHFLGGDAIDPARPAYDSLVDVTPGTPAFARIVDLFLKAHVYFDATLTAYGYFADRGEAYDPWVEERQFFTPYARQITGNRRPRIEAFGRIYEVKQATLKAFFDAGGAGLITLGTDHASTGEFLPGFSVHREMHAMVLAGLPAAAVLDIATINGARALNLGDRLGSVETGKWADLIVVRGNPLADITNTRQVRAVMKNGVLYDPGELLDSVRDTIGPADASEAADW